MDFEEVAMLPGALRVLRALGEREPMTMGMLKAATGLSQERLKPLRAKLEAGEILQAEQHSGKGATKRLEIRLTPFGRDLAAHAEAMAALFEARRAARPKLRHSSG